MGGRNRQVRVVLDKDKLAASGLDFLGVAEMIKANNQQMSSGSFDKNDTEFLVTTGNFLKSVTDVENLVVGVQQNQPIYLKQVAAIFDGPEIPRHYVSFGFGGASDNISELSFRISCGDHFRSKKKRCRCDENCRCDYR